MDGPQVTIFVCVSCRSPGSDAADSSKAELVEALRRKFDEASAEGVTVTPIECLAVCKRPATIAMVGPGKWTYLIGDLESAQLDEVVAGTLAYQPSENGIVPWKERPASFRKGVVARIPPLGFVMPVQEST